MQKKLNEVQESETANKHLTKYQKNYERRLKDLEGQLARSKNLYKGKSSLFLMARLIVFS